MGGLKSEDEARMQKYISLMRPLFKKRAVFSDETRFYRKLSTSAESPAGHIVNVAVLKTKTSKWDRKVGSYRLNYTKGVDVLSDTLDVAIHFGFIDNSTQGTFKLIDPSTGELMIDADGKEIKIRGKANLRTYFNDHLDIWKRLYDLVYDKIRQKDDPYCVSFEKMLDINFETFGIDSVDNVGEI